MNVAAHELVDRDVLLEDLVGSPGATLTQRVLETRSPSVRLHLLQEFLIGRLSVVRPEDKVVNAVASHLARARSARLEALSRSVGLSQRQLLRRCRERLGYGPKTLHRILRLQRLLLLARRHKWWDEGLAALAYASGYSDQAHMAREVQALTGTTPRSLLRRETCTLAMSDLFKTDLGEFG